MPPAPLYFFLMSWKGEDAAFCTCWICFVIQLPYLVLSFSGALFPDKLLDKRSLEHRTGLKARNNIVIFGGGAKDKHHQAGIHVNDLAESLLDKVTLWSLPSPKEKDTSRWKWKVADGDAPRKALLPRVSFSGCRRMFPGKSIYPKVEGSVPIFFLTTQVWHKCSLYFYGLMVAGREGPKQPCSWGSTAVRDSEFPSVCKKHTEEQPAGGSWWCLATTAQITTPED